MYIDTFVAFVSELVVFSILFHLYLSFIALKLGHLLMLLLLFDDVDDTSSSWLSLLSHVLALVPPVAHVVLVAIVVVDVIGVSFNRCHCFWRFSLQILCEGCKTMPICCDLRCIKSPMECCECSCTSLKGWREWSKARACFWFRLVDLSFLVLSKNDISIVCV